MMAQPINGGIQNRPIPIRSLTSYDIEDRIIPILVHKNHEKTLLSYDGCDSGSKKNYVEDKIIPKLVHKNHEKTLLAYDHCNSKKENSKK